MPKSTLKIIILASCLVAVACTTVVEVDTLDGSVIYSITCAGQNATLNECYRKAAKICKSNHFLVLGSKGNEYPFKYNSSPDITPPEKNSVMLYNAYIQRKIKVKCNY